MVAVMELRKSGYVPERSIVLAFSGDEETTMITSKAIAERLRGARLVLNVDGASGTAGDGAPKSALAMWLIARVRPAGSASGTVGAVGERTTAALTPGDTLGGCRVVGSTRLSSPGGCGCSGVLMVPVDGDVLEDAEGVVDEDGSGAVEGHEILGRALLVDAHQPDRE
jgi:hypothetical protein